MAWKIQRWISGLFRTRGNPEEYSACKLLQSDHWELGLALNVMSLALALALKASSWSYGLGLGLNLKVTPVVLVCVSLALVLALKASSWPSSLWPWHWSRPLWQEYNCLLIKALAILLLTYLLTYLISCSLNSICDQEAWNNRAQHCEGYTWTPSSLPFSATVSIIFFITSACLSQTTAQFWNTAADYCFYNCFYNSFYNLLHHFGMSVTNNGTVLKHCSRLLQSIQLIYIDQISLG